MIELALKPERQASATRLGIADTVLASESDVEEQVLDLTVGWGAKPQPWPWDRLKRSRPPLISPARWDASTSLPGPVF